MPKLLEADRTALATALLGAWDAASGACTLEFYDGTQPAGPATAVGAQVKLGTLTASDPLGVAAAGLLTFDPITQDSAADAGGTAAWARLKDGAGTARADFSVSATGGAGEIQLNTVTIVAGGPILMTSFVLTMPGA